ncbi:MAG TPA: NUDIX domain-containing protein [Ktedonobacterales bacterium]|nr:NUDIX domain-containing protein [Ktedonobacterales bacterium]
MTTETTDVTDSTPRAQPNAAHTAQASGAPASAVGSPHPAHATGAPSAADAQAEDATPGRVDTPAEVAHDRATYDPSRYERPSVTVDVVILTMRQRRLEALLVKRRHWPFEGMWAIPGGFVNPDESLEDSARRELAEETNVRDVYLEQLYTFGDPGRDPRTRVITVVYYALIRAEELAGVPQAGDDAAETAWFPVYTLPTMAFDHENILTYTMDRMRGKLEYTSIGFQLLPPEFTLSELQEVYQAIMNRPLDKRNFRKKVLSTGILEATTNTRNVGRHRPAALYRFSPRAGS